METNKSIVGDILNTISESDTKKIENKMLIAAKIDEAMKAKGWRKIDLMNAMGKKNQSEVTRWLSGTHNFTADLLTDLGEVLSVNFFNLESNSIKPNIYRITTSVYARSIEGNLINEIGESSNYYNTKKLITSD